MAARMCPYCLKKLPATTVVVHSYDLVCPGCQRPLEISRISRNIAAFAGLIAGGVAWYFATGAAPSHQALGWVFPILYAIVAYGFVSVLTLLLSADLSLKSEPHEAQIPAPSEAASAGHGSGHH